MEYIFLVSLCIIAFLYSSVGHGGGSGYLALMALFGIAPEFMKSTALILNVFVSLIAFISFYRAGYFKLSIIIPFLITSMPLSYFGSLIHINPSLYKIILGVFLIIAVARMLLIPKSISDDTKQPPVIASLLIGAVLGFFSGMIGIGGGIILSPILILFRWANIKETAAASALFIFLNSLSGLVGLYHIGFHLNSHIIPWIIAGVLGGIAGSYSGSFKLQSARLKIILSGVLLMASIKLFIL